MEKKMYCNFVLSLKDICFRRVAVILITRIHCTEAYFNLFSIELDVKAYVKTLELPRLLAEKMTYVVLPIQSEIKDWRRFHQPFLDITFVYLVKYTPFLCWTNVGAVDYRKSVENLIHYEVVDIVRCYKLACFYCLDDYIPVLWEKLSEKDKSHFYKEGRLGNTKPTLEFCWPYILKGEETKLNNMLEVLLGNPTTVNQYAFEYSSDEGNKAATEYFFRKLTNAERESSLFRALEAVLDRQYDDIMRHEDLYSLHLRSDTFFYLLSLMSFEMQMEIFKQLPLIVLINFIDWPWQNISLDITKLIWPYLTAEEYATALEIISMTIKSGFNLTKVFQELFLHGTSDFRKYFVDQECLSGVSFRSFFKVEDSENIKIIFRGVDSEDRKKLVFSMRVVKHFYKSILTRKCGMVQLCLREAFLSNEDKEELKEAFLRVLTEVENQRIERTQMIRKFKSFFSSSEDEEEKREDSYESETEIDASDINRKKYVWEQFLRIIDEDNLKTPYMSWSEEYTYSPVSLSDTEDFFKNNAKINNVILKKK